ncbi:hypothetical protein MY3296_007230 [Beauveria thailandica]
MLVHHLAAKQHRSYEARLFRMTLAFRKRATDRAASWRLLSEAALYSDAEYATSGVVRGPLHGLLGSLRNCLKIVGTDARIGKGTLLDDEIVKPLVPVTRALIQTRAVLEESGHKVVEFRMCECQARLLPRLFPVGMQCVIRSDGQYHLVKLKFTLYRSATGDALMKKILGRRQESWPREYEVLAQWAQRGKSRLICNGEWPEGAVYSLSGQEFLSSGKPKSKRTDFSERVLLIDVGGSKVTDG